MNASTYEVLEAETAEDLADMVSNAVAVGKIPCGGLAIFPARKLGQDFSEFHFFQAVCSPDALLPAARWLQLQLDNPCPPRKHARK